MIDAGLPQLPIQKFAGPPVGKRCGGGVVVCPIVPGEGVVLTRIAVDRRVGFASECLLDFRLCGLGNELILLGQMHQQGRMETAELAEILLGVTAVVGNCSVNAVAHGRQEGHQRPEAVAKYGNPGGALGHPGHGVSGVLDIPNTSISVIGLIEAKTVLPVWV